MPILRSFVLTQKNQKVKNPESLIRAVFFPPRLGVDLASGSCWWLLIMLNTSFINYFLKLMGKPERSSPERYPPRRVGLKGRPEAIRPFLIFCFFLIKQKEIEEGERPDQYKKYFLLSKPAVAGFTFFCLDTKEPKGQESRIPHPGGLLPTAPGCRSCKRPFPAVNHYYSKLLLSTFFFR